MRTQRAWSKEARQRHAEGIARYQERRRESAYVENVIRKVWELSEKIGETPDDVLRGVFDAVEKNEVPSGRQAFKEKITTMKELLKRGEIEDPLRRTLNAV
jgi:hypothetical protein